MPRMQWICGLEPQSGQTKDYKISISCFSTKLIALRRKIKDWLARYHDSVSEWRDMSTRRLLFQWTSTVNIQLGMLVWYKVDLIIISLKINLFLPWYSWKIAELALNNNHSLTHINFVPKLWNFAIFELMVSFKGIICKSCAWLSRISY
jgi:hypothetical protein